MLRSLNTAVSGLQQFQEDIDVIGNNIANVNTTGFKGSRVAFEDTLSLALSAGNQVNQVGTGVATASIQTNYSQGTINNTGYQSDLAISGGGYFVVRNVNSSAQFATRAGDFHLDSSGYLTTSDGFRVQGYNDSGLTTIGDLQIDATGAPSTAAAGATVKSWGVDADGKITVTLSDNTTFVRGQVLLQNFTNQSALYKEGANLYSWGAAAGPLAQPTPPQTSGLGQIVAGALEMSNVDLTNEMANLITAQRAFQSNARVVTTSDEILQEVTNLKR